MGEAFVLEEPPLSILFDLALPMVAQAHGGVVAGEDECIIEVGVYRAHFTIYQPESRAAEEFCEEVPEVEKSIFVMEYLHDSMREVPVDFRIIPDVLGRTIYAAPEDLENIEDIDAITAFYQPPVTRPEGSFMVQHDFLEPGWYTGIVTAEHPTLDRRYTAVFGFHVGRQGWGFWPWVILGLLAVQLQYWIGSGGFARWRARRAELREGATS